MSGYDNSAYYSAQSKELPTESQPPPVYFKPTDVPPDYADSQAHTIAEERFTGKRVWNDVWAIVLYWINFACFAGLCFYGIYTLVKENDTRLSLKFSKEFFQKENITNTTVDNVLSIKMIVTALPVAVGVAVVMTLIYALLVYYLTKAMLIASYFFSVLIMLATGAYLLYLKAYIAGAILCIIGALVAAVFCCIYQRIDFTAQLVKCVMLVISKYPSIAIITFVALILQVGLALLWGFGLAGCKVKFGDNTGVLAAVSIFLIFSFFWNSQYVSNTVHTACSGVFCAYYFLGETVQMPSRPVGIAVRNALGPASGSVAVGSLIIAIIQTLRTIVKMVAGKNSSGWMQLIGCCLDCLLGAVEATAKYFNRYAFVQVAIYGRSFYQSAKACVSLFGRKGFDAIINDNLAENLFLLGGCAVGVLSGVAGWLVASEFNTMPGGFGLVVGLICGAVGLFLFSVLSGMISSGITSIFVCLAEDPRALMRTKPELYEKIRQVYPEIDYPVN